MADARTITLALRGRWRRRYGVAFCPAHANTRTPALRLADGHDGRLLAVCGAGCPFADVAAALRGLGLLSGAGRDFAPDPIKAAQRAAAEARERAQGITRARTAWAEAGPIAGTLGDRYLRARAVRGPLPASLRFHGNCWHPTAKRLPAMVAAVTLGADLVAVHRTYLAEPGRKADIDPPKAMLGPVAGGAVRLAGGPGPLVLAEGLETALSLADGLADLAPRVWAALSTSGLTGLALPPTPGDLIIGADGDAPGQKAARDLATRAHALGWGVRILAAPTGHDWNDLAREGVA